MAYHKGQKNSSIQDGEHLEINDLIIDQAGAFTFDWEKNDLRIIHELKQKHKISLQSAKNNFKNPHTVEPCVVRSLNNYCGSGGYRGGC